MKLRYITLVIISFFIFFINADALVCEYGSNADTFILKLEFSNGSVTCSSTGSYTLSAYACKSTGLSKTATTCPSVVYTNVSCTTVGTDVDNPRCSVQEVSVNEFEGSTKVYLKTSDSAESNEDSDDEENIINTFDTESFCTQNNVKVAFRMVGWVIWILKIIVPVILIVFGTIELTNVVLSGKTESIGKTVKSLIIRLVAGIIIFLVPKFLDLVLNLIGGMDIFKGSTFNQCTTCLLDPSNETDCSTQPLFEEN